MHILIIPAANFAPSQGRGIFELQQAKALQNEGHRVSIICAGYAPFTNVFRPKEPISTIVQDGIAIYQRYKKPLIPLRFVNKYGLYNQRAAFEDLALRCFADHGTADIIHAHNSLFAGYSARLLSRRFHIPYVVTEHDSSHARHLLSSRTKQMSRVTMQQADAVIAVSQFQKSQISPLLGTDSDNLTVIGNMIDPLLEKPAVQDIQQRANDALSLLTIGSLDENKNHKLLLQGFAELCAKNHKYHLTIIGDGNQKIALKNYSRELGIADKVLFTGYLDREDLVNHLERANIYIHTSMIETFGVSMIEALARGKIVITTKSGGPRDFITPHNGIFIDDMTPAMVARAIDEVAHNFNNYQPQKIAADIMSHYRASHIAKQLILLYEDILARDSLR